MSKIIISFIFSLGIAFYSFMLTGINENVSQKRTALKAETPENDQESENNIDSVSDSEQEEEYAEATKYIDYTWEALVERIKVREHLELEPYYCAGGHVTIGYGHIMNPGDSAMLVNGQITPEQADSLLHADLNLARQWVSQTLKLEGKQLMAITNFCYAFGSSKLQRSRLFKKIKNKQPIKDEILKWVHINGQPSNYLRKERIFELNLYRAGELDS
ncbi:MAG: lysozyme [Bernardetiaceae bacterium]|nr:lysozyme [Bernardetiaceae bacterium]